MRKNRGIEYISIGGERQIAGRGMESRVEPVRHVHPDGHPATSSSGPTRQRVRRQELAAKPKPVATTAAAKSPAAKRRADEEKLAAASESLRRSLWDDVESARRRLYGLPEPVGPADAAKIWAR